MNINGVDVEKVDIPKTEKQIEKTIEKPAEKTIKKSNKRKPVSGAEQPKEETVNTEEI